MKKVIDKLAVLHSIIEAAETYLKNQGYPVTLTDNGMREYYDGSRSYCCKLQVQGVDEQIVFTLYNNRIKVYSEDRHNERILHSTVKKHHLYNIGERFDRDNRQQYVKSTNLFLGVSRDIHNLFKAVRDVNNTGKNGLLYLTIPQIYAVIEVWQKDVGSAKMEKIKSYCTEFTVTETKYRDTGCIASISISLDVTDLHSLKTNAQKVRILYEKFDISSFRS
jgi:hypothetical protein